MTLIESGADDLMRNLHIPAQRMDGTVGCSVCNDGGGDPVEFPCATIQVLDAGRYRTSERCRSVAEWNRDHPVDTEVVHAAAQKHRHTTGIAFISVDGRAVVPLCGNTDPVPLADLVAKEWS